MQTFSLASEPALATLSSHFPNSVRTSFVPYRGSVHRGGERIQGRSAAISATTAVIRISRKGQGVTRLISAGLDERVREVLGFWTSRDGAVRDSLPCHRHYPLPRSGLRRLQACRRGMRGYRRLGAKSDRPARNQPMEAARRR